MGVIKRVRLYVLAHTHEAHGRAAFEPALTRMRGQRFAINAPKNLGLTLILSAVDGSRPAAIFAAIAFEGLEQTHESVAQCAFDTGSGVAAIRANDFALPKHDGVI